MPNEKQDETEQIVPSMTIKDFGVVNGNQATLLQYSDGFGCLRILDAKERGQLKIEQEQNPAQDENGLITF